MKKKQNVKGINVAKVIGKSKVLKKDLKLKNPL